MYTEKCRSFVLILSLCPPTRRPKHVSVCPITLRKYLVGKATHLYAYLPTFTYVLNIITYVVVMLSDDLRIYLARVTAVVVVVGVGWLVAILVRKWHVNYYDGHCRLGVLCWYLVVAIQANT